MNNKFFLMRHAQSDHNVGNWISADEETDKKSQLTKTGIEQTHRLGKELKKVGIDLIYHSPFQRVAATCSIVNQYLKVPVLVERRLSQMNCGVFNGKIWAERERFFLDEVEKLSKRPPGGESLLDLKARMVAALRDINARHQQKKILIISHGNPLRLLQLAALNLPDVAVFTDRRVVRWKSDVSPEPFFDELLINENFSLSHPVDLSSLRCINLTERQMFDLELILVNGFAPLKGFLKEEDYFSVMEKMRLQNGALWPMPIVLDWRQSDRPVLGETVALCDHFGNPLAFMKVESVYQPDKIREARLVYGTEKLSHPGVAYLFNNTHDWYVGGEVSFVGLPIHYAFRELRKTPAELKEFFRQGGWDKVIGFNTRNPIHRAHFELMRNAARHYQAKVLLHPIVGSTNEGDVDYITRVRTYKIIHERYMKDFAFLSLLPLAMRMAGPREAVWHALVRKNYGCSHFIVGRDHAGPKDESGNPFYDKYASQELAKQYADEIGIEIITPKEMAYVEEENRYLPIDQIAANQTVKVISGTALREMLLSGAEFPDWFSFPETIGELRRWAELKNYEA